MAVHAALTAPPSGKPGRGYLASLRSVSFHQDRLDVASGVLTIEASCLHRETGRAMYSFEIRTAGRSLLEGRAVVVIEPGTP
jgi:predicted hotdog family 3-hydroxylacyl-ACP dehydratase